MNYYLPYRQKNKAQLEKVMAEHDLPYTHIGEIVSAGQSEQINYFNDNQLTSLALQGWDHFQ